MKKLSDILGFFTQASKKACVENDNLLTVNKNDVNVNPQPKVNDTFCLVLVVALMLHLVLPRCLRLSH